MYLLIWKSQPQIEREKQAEWTSLWDPLLRWWRWPGLGQVEGRKQELHLVSHVGTGAQGLEPSVVAVPGTSARSWVANGAAGTWIGAHRRCLCHKPCLYPLCRPHSSLFYSVSWLLPEFTVTKSKHPLISLAIKVFTSKSRVSGILAQLCYRTIPTD